MKGLLIKDIKLIQGQKNLLYLIIAMPIIIMLYSDNASFLLGYIPFCLSSITLSTIGYDKADNGNLFLFSLPISRKNYAIEKYCFSLLVGGSAWIFATILSLVIDNIKGTGKFEEMLMTALMILPFILLIQAIMIPLQLKFGREKGRLTILGLFVVLFGIGAAVVKITEAFDIDIVSVLDSLSTVSMGVLATSAIFIAIVILLISMTISISIMNKKEF